MSTQSQHRDSRVESPATTPSTPAKDVFRDLILDNGSICSRCCRLQRSLTKIVVPDRKDARNSLEQDQRFIQVGNTDGGTVEYVRPEINDDIEVVYPPRISRSRAHLIERDLDAGVRESTPPPQTQCKCGDVDDASPGGETWSLEAILEIGERLSDRLDEIGVKHDKSLLLSSIEKKKKCPPIQARDYDIVIAHSVELAVAKARQQTARRLRYDEDGNIQFEKIPAEAVPWFVSQDNRA